MSRYRVDIHNTTFDPRVFDIWEQSTSPEDACQRLIKEGFAPSSAEAFVKLMEVISRDTKKNS